jgi:hypothetical protein
VSPAVASRSSVVGGLDDTMNHDMEKNRATRFSATSRR